MSRLPFQDTSVSVTKSQGAIKELLYACGFTSVADMSNNSGKHVIVAEAQAIQFKFEVNLNDILDSLQRTRTSEQIKREIANKQAWRCLYFQVKSIHDSIKLGIIDIAEGFAGNLMLPDKAGNRVKMADYIKSGMESGRLTSQTITDKFLLESGKE